MTNKNFIIIGDSHVAHLVSGFKTLTTRSVTDLSSSGCIPFRNVDRYDSRYIPDACVETMNVALDSVISAKTDAVGNSLKYGPVYLNGTSFNGKDVAGLKGLKLHWSQIGQSRINRKYSRLACEKRYENYHKSKIHK